jgi:hypothetical protein
MGMTVHYRGRITDLTRTEDFEDRLVDLALEIGGQVRIWRSWADDDPERMVRGIILDLGPGHESASLLLSPEGWLIGLTEIEDAENGRLDEPPWCSVKTQFGAAEGHVGLIEILTGLNREFVNDLEVIDEGGYWETRDLAELIRKRSFLKAAIDGLAEGLKRYGLSHEAAEDPSILLRHVERVAEQVQRNLVHPAEYTPAASRDDERAPLGESLEGDAAGRITGSRLAGDDLLETVEERHPLRQWALDLCEKLDSVFYDEIPEFAASLAEPYQIAHDAMGSLAQALSDCDDAEKDYGLRVVQLKRALRGAAFARGALFALRTAIRAEQFDEFLRLLRQMEQDIVSDLGRVRSDRLKDHQTRAGEC